MELFSNRDTKLVCTGSGDVVIIHGSIWVGKNIYKMRVCIHRNFTTKKTVFLRLKVFFSYTSLISFYKRTNNAHWLSTETKPQRFATHHYYFLQTKRQDKAKPISIKSIGVHIEGGGNGKGGREYDDPGPFSSPAYSSLPFPASLPDYYRPLPCPALPSTKQTLHRSY